MIKSGNFRFTVIQIEGKSTLQHGQKAEVTLEIMDTQSVRWGNNCSFGGFDGAKKVKGMKRHVVEQISGAVSMRFQFLMSITNIMISYFL